ncbi:uncharacterized protein LOC105440187 [Strongylocentrotus purpuratus]|uniref:Death domain-containing protein n=1 Tax=Strongylocentrotus purpuratus TaxID=7668 RepID=A0A7M7PSQ9_STRPU|nr:uncharacterized protein LOC105440187 [Strongylocentrotus purpuratus]
MTTNRMPFTLQRREEIVSGVLVTFILEQKIKKDIQFHVWYNDVPHENPSAQSSPTGTASPRGKAEPTDVGRITSKSRQLSEEVTRSDHHLETIGTTSPEPADTKDGSSHTDVLTSPSPLTPPSKESSSCEHAYQVTHDLVTETGAIASTSCTMHVHTLEASAEGTMGVLAPPATVANIVQEFVQGLSADRKMHHRSGNVYINIQENVINNPQGNNPQENTVAPVAIVSVVPPRLQHELRCRLNRESPVFGDWRGLADQLGLEEYIKHLEQCKNPTEELLELAESKKKIQNLGDLAKAFERMNRGDCQELCENYAFEKTKSANPRKDQMEDDDTDTSD